MSTLRRRRDARCARTRSPTPPPLTCAGATGSLGLVAAVHDLAVTHPHGAVEPDVHRVAARAAVDQHVAARGVRVDQVVARPTAHPVAPGAAQVDVVTGAREDRVARPPEGAPAASRFPPNPSSPPQPSRTSPPGPPSRRS